LAWPPDGSSRPELRRYAPYLTTDRETRAPRRARIGAKPAPCILLERLVSWIPTERKPARQFRAAFIIAVALAIIALLVQYAHAAIPTASGHAFETMLLAFLILLAGNLFRGM